MQAGKRLRAVLTATGVISAALLATAVPAVAAPPPDLQHQPPGQAGKAHPSPAQGPSQAGPDAATSPPAGGSGNAQAPVSLPPSAVLNAVGPAVGSATSALMPAALAKRGTALGQEAAALLTKPGQGHGHAAAAQITRGHFGAALVTQQSTTTPSLRAGQPLSGNAGGSGTPAGGAPASQPAASSPAATPLLTRPGGGGALTGPPPVNPVPNPAAPPQGVETFPAQLTSAQLDWLLVLLVAALALGLAAAIRLARRTRGGPS